MKSILSGTVLLALLLAGATFAAAAPGSVTPSPAASTPTWPYALYGDTVTGWGLTPTTITSPGPTLVVTTGEQLDLHLYSHDGVTHTWFLDLNNDSVHQSTESISAPFNATTGPIWVNLTVSQGPGTYTYRCSIHPGTMWGELVVLPAPTYTLWGSAGTVHGWGLTAASITQPGPTLNVQQGQTVTIDLFSADGVAHNFYVDFARTNSTSGNTVSATFNGTHPVRFTFVPSQAGNFTYACGIHGASVMSGTLDVASSAAPAPPSSPPDYTVYAAAIVVIVIVAIVVAVVIRRRPKTPPAQPPVNPPSPPQG